jgi:hypothetical protein
MRSTRGYSSEAFGRTSRPIRHRSCVMVRCRAYALCIRTRVYHREVPKFPAYAAFILPGRMCARQCEDTSFLLCETPLCLLCVTEEPELV